MHASHPRGSLWLLSPKSNHRILVVGLAKPYHFVEKSKVAAPAKTCPHTRSRKWLLLARGGRITFLGARGVLWPMLSPQNLRVEMPDTRQGSLQQNAGASCNSIAFPASSV
jgi:hypothetical protein